MATFSKKSKNGWSGVFTYKAPMSLTDPAWEDLVEVPSVHIVELALRGLVIDGQRVLDGCKTYKEALEVWETWKFGMKVRRVATVEVAKELTADLEKSLGLTEEQVKLMREAGIIK